LILRPRLLLWFLSLALIAGLLAGQQHSPSPPAQSPPSERAAPGASQHTTQEAEHHPESGLRDGIFKWINFLALFGLLGYLLRKPMAGFLAGRTQAIQKALEEGRRARQEAAGCLQEISQRLARIEWEIAELKKAAAGEADAERKRLLAAARAENERILALAEQEIRALAKSARAELKSYVAALAVELAEQRIRTRLTPERQAALLREYAVNLRSKHT